MRVCFIGDSFVNGTNDPCCLGWVGRVCAAARAGGTDLTVYNLGIRRDTSADVAARWQAEAASRLPPAHAGLLVFSFGVNDCCDDRPGRRRLEGDRSLAAARLILERGQAFRPTLMIGPPAIADDAVNARIGQLSAAFAVLCAELGVPYLDTFTPLAAHPLWRAEVAATDGAHPGAAGYDLLAAQVAAWPAWCQAVAG